MTVVRLVMLDGLDAATVLGVYAARIAGFREAIEDGRIRDRQRLAPR